MDPFLLNLISVAFLLLLLLFGTFFSAAEMAFASLNRARIKSLAESDGAGSKRAKLVMNLYEQRFDEIISTLLICNNTVAITSATVSVALFTRLIGDVGYLLSTVVISAIVIVLTDIFPKSLSKGSPEKVAMACAPFVRVLMALCRPMNIGIIKMKNSLGANFFTKPEENETEQQNMINQEILFMVEEAEKDGAMNEDDSLLITNAIEFNDVLAWDILTPRVNIVSIPMGASIEEIAELFLESGYSRMPVYEDSLDTIRGIIHIRDFLKCMASGAGGGKPVSVEDIITPAVFTVTSARVTDVLTVLKKEKSHMAIVADEYGGTEGLVTMEDILEQLVGDIWDENDEVIEEFLPLGNNKHKVLCTAGVDKMFEYFDMEAESESNTVSGWITDMFRHLPEVGESFTFEKLTVTVTKIDGPRVEECEVEVVEPEEETNEDSSNS
ncbi:MAG: hemolysin family protein [Defluviitaleaceae bacterium]|nr:hemolysin family protein [Defluviitaleaceae bacterium]